MSFAVVYVFNFKKLTKMKKVDLNLLSKENLAQIQGGNDVNFATIENEITSSTTLKAKNNKNSIAGCICEYLNASSITNTNKATQCSCECVW